MVHLRLNDPDTSRNPHINYITSLPCYPDHEEARRRLLQIAAIFRPIMKKHGLQINSFEEYEPNPEFSGRNWNAGETIELVIRKRGTKKGEGGGGGFVPFPLLCYVMSHELAHSFEMNHSSRHATWTKQFAQECRELQQRGYYGDGMWSAGRRLNDSEWCQGSSELSSEAVPASLCGGAWKKGRSSNGGRKRRRTGPDGKYAPTTRRKKGTPSLHTGAQTARNIESTAGKRRAYVALPGEGLRVDGRDYIPKASAKTQDYKLDENSTFRKRANTRAARDLRAAATLKRINVLQANACEEAKDEGQEKARGRFDQGQEIKSGLPGLFSAGLLDQSEIGGERRTPIDSGLDSNDEGDRNEKSGTEDDTDEDGDCLYDSATDEQAEDWPLACGSAGPRQRSQDGSVPPADTRPLSAPSPSSVPRQTLSSTETSDQRRRRMERYRQSLNSSREGVEGAGEQDEEWQTVIKDVQRLGVNQRRLDALQQAPTLYGGQRSGSVAPTFKSEAQSTKDRKPAVAASSATPCSTSSSDSVEPSINKAREGRRTLGGDPEVREGQAGVSRLLSLRPITEVPTTTESDTESDGDDEIICTGFRKAGH